MSSTSPMTPSKALGTHPLSPLSIEVPPPLPPRKDNTDTLEDVHLGEYARYGRSPRRSSTSQTAVVRTAELGGDGSRPSAPPTPIKTEAPGTPSIPPKAVPAYTAGKQVMQSTPVPVQIPSMQDRFLLIQGEREWHKGLFSCFDLKTSEWCTGCFCPCVTFSEVRHAARHPEDDGNSDFNKWCNTTCWAWYCLGYCTGGIGSTIFSAVNRNDLRQSTGIHGNGCEDCLTSWFCLHCEHCQELEQVRQDRALLLAQKRATSQVMAYQAQPAMSYGGPGPR